MFVLHGHRLCRDIAVVLIAFIAIWILDIYCIFIVKLETGDSQGLKNGVYRITPPPSPTKERRHALSWNSTTQRWEDDIIFIQNKQTTHEAKDHPLCQRRPTSTRLKNGMTADSTGEPVLWWLDIYLRDESQRAEEFRIFIVNIGYS